MSVEPILLPEELKISSLDGYKSEIDALEFNKNIEIDGSKVSAIDAAGIQFLIAFIYDQKTHDREVKWLSVSEVLKESAKIVGAFDVLELA